MPAIKRLSLLGLSLACGLTVAVLPATAAQAASSHTATARTGGIALNVRAGSSIANQRVDRLADGSRLRVSCFVTGQRITGQVRTTTRWNRLTSGHYVSDAYVAWRTSRATVPRCRPAATGATKTATTATVRSPALPLNVRRSAGTQHPRLGVLANGTRLAVSCQLVGQMVDGAVRRTALWNRRTDGTFVSDAYVSWRPARPQLPQCALTSAAPTGQGAFIAWAAGHARKSQDQYRVPASVTIAQAILESGWGGSALTREGNAYFGMKCFGDPGPVAIGCRSYRTSECEGRRCFGITDSFRVYRSAADSFHDHSRQLASLPRYRAAFAHTKNPDRFATEVHRAGYATSPTYAKNLINLMKQYQLYRYDKRG